MSYTSLKRGEISIKYEKTFYSWYICLISLGACGSPCGVSTYLPETTFNNKVWYVELPTFCTRPFKNEASRPESYELRIAPLLTVSWIANVDNTVMLTDTRFRCPSTIVFTYPARGLWIAEWRIGIGRSGGTRRRSTCGSS